MKSAPIIGPHPLDAALLSLEAAVQRLEETDFSRLSNQELIDAMVALEVVMRRLEFGRRRLVAEMVKRTLTEQTGGTVLRGIFVRRPAALSARPSAAHPRMRGACARQVKQPTLPSG